jgi:hypothetical protein
MNQVMRREVTGLLKEGKDEQARIRVRFLAFLATLLLFFRLNISHFESISLFNFNYTNAET